MRRTSVVIGAVVVMSLPPAASAHQSPGSPGHVPSDVNYGLRPVGHDTLGGVEPGRYTDVWAHGGYAYVGTFQLPACDTAGVYISDISDPAAPTTVTMIPSPPATRVNDVKTVRVGGRTVLIHSLEPCAEGGSGGISLYDVTDPTRPQPLEQGFLGVSVHNTYPWTDVDSGRSFVIVVENTRGRDAALVEITEPAAPRLLAEVGLPDWPEARDAQAAGIGTLPLSANHDVRVQRLPGGDYRAVLSYWDTGFVVLDVDDPSAPEFVDDFTYRNPDALTGARPPEGNGHAAVFDPVDAEHIYAGDEDFGPFRSSFALTDGPNSGTYAAADATFTTPLRELDDAAMDGRTTYVGLACQEGLPPADAAGDIAVAQRGVCTFSTKARTASALGYGGLIVFNDATNGDELVTMGGEPIDLPAVFVGHATGLAIFDVASADGLAVGDRGAPVSARVEFDGWGYFRLLDRRTLEEVGFYAPGQVDDADYARGFGDLTMHNVEGDPRHAERAFISWYSLGMRAVEVVPGASVRPTDGDWDAAVPARDDYYGDNVTEVGRFIAPNGSNFWGVHVTEVDGVQYILGSDRNTGLWIFRFDPSYCRASDGRSCPPQRQPRVPNGIRISGLSLS